MGLHVHTTAARGIAAFQRVRYYHLLRDLPAANTPPPTNKHTFHNSIIDKRPHILAYTK